LCRAERDVIDFLRATLAERAHPVIELEASARAAGLLNEGQRITHAKAFKRAKKSLGIRSLHAGFGALVASGYGNCRARTKRGLTQSRKRHLCSTHQCLGFQAIGSKGSLASILIVRPLTFRATAGGSS